MINILIDTVGWVGSASLIIAYWLVSKNRIQAQSGSYHLLNIIGSLFLLINSSFYGALPSAAINMIFIFIGIFYLSKLYTHAK